MELGIAHMRIMRRIRFGSLNWPWEAGRDPRKLRDTHSVMLCVQPGGLELVQTHISYSPVQ
ncbi:hypothetical protein N7466_005862 [Penicillium verhagenii]|uniref:uncharacterized protein n=1 Tax=Penicillium verhagenii TaxID=1562060 RepID=UPI002545807E|nr:uncharacterized protein N7466_005862 [Penicillium verhagenii]KAJ5930369.1 hypothetical protein N7466_005862 [Penicillium verhagenii]